jgi:DNA-directed RNA polymerase subunit alpha
MDLLIQKMHLTEAAKVLIHHLCCFDERITLEADEIAQTDRKHEESLHMRHCLKLSLLIWTCL